MKQHLVQSVFFGLRIFAIVVLLTLTAAILVSFKADKTYFDFWQQMGITEKDGASSIKESFLYGYLQHYSARKAKNLAAGDREAVTKDLLAYTKQYVQGDEFKHQYEKERIARKPAEPEKPETEAQIRKKNIESIKEGMANLEKAMKDATAENKKIYKGGYDMLAAQLKDYEDPKSEMVKMMVEGAQSSYEYNMKDYQAKLARWEKEYPAEAAGFIKRRLQQMLEATQDIDYNAALTERNGKKYFVKKEYESKSPEWKCGFRAGKEVTETARAFVQQWIKEL